MMGGRVPAVDCAEAMDAAAISRNDSALFRTTHSLLDQQSPGLLYAS